MSRPFHLQMPLHFLSYFSQAMDHSNVEWLNDICKSSQLRISPNSRPCSFPRPFVRGREEANNAFACFLLGFGIYKHWWQDGSFSNKFHLNLKNPSSVTEAAMLHFFFIYFFILQCWWELTKAIALITGQEGFIFTGLTHVQPLHSRFFLLEFPSRLSGNKSD